MLCSLFTSRSLYIKTRAFPTLYALSTCHKKTNLLPFFAGHNLYPVKTKLLHLCQTICRRSIFLSVKQNESAYLCNLRVQNLSTSSHQVTHAFQIFGLFANWLFSPTHQQLFAAPINKNNNFFLLS